MPVCLLLAVLCLFSLPGSSPALAQPDSGQAAAAPLSRPVGTPPEEELVLREIPLLPARPKARIVLVLDGDTLRLGDRRTIRLACIDAPELALSSPTTFVNQELREENFRAEEAAPADQAGQAKKARQARPLRKELYFAREAQQALRKLALKKKATLRCATSKKDPQGRLVCDVLLEDGTSLSAFMVEHGFAYVVRDADFPGEYVQMLLRLQVRAMANRRGFWGVILSLEAAKHPWIGNTQTHLFYSSQDVRGQQIKPRLRQYFGTLLDAFSSGFAPARSLDFWPAS